MAGQSGRVSTLAKCLTDVSRTSIYLNRSNFPCKGYQKDIPSVSRAVANLTAGRSTTVSFLPGATHGGGSCQFSLSYDGGNTFGVIHSIIGGCPLQTSYTFNVPSDAPAGNDVILSWSWFNKVGNREMYQNCIAVNLVSSSTAPIKLPRMFQANIFGAGTCNTVEGDEVAFPNPGNSVEYGGKWGSTKPGQIALQLTNCGGDKLAAESSFVTLSGNGKSVPVDNSDIVTISVGKPSETTSRAQPIVTPSTAQEPSSTSVEATTPAVSSKAAVVSKSAPVIAVPSSSTSSQPARMPIKIAASSPAAVAAPLPTSGTACSDTGIVCSADGSSFSVCSSGRLIDMGSVAAGTICRNGAISAIPVSGMDKVANVSCTVGQLLCSTDGKSFSICDVGGKSYVNMGGVAAGTVCKDGVIQLLSTSNRRAKRSNRHHRRLDTFH